MKKKIVLSILLINSCLCTLMAQTDLDGLIMAKNNFCVGITAGSSNWQKYWEGTTERSNSNLGKFTSNNYTLMGNYGVSNKLNLIFGIPYISNKVSAGQLNPESGIQDLSLFAKYNLIEKNILKGLFNLYLVGGYSNPLSNYSPDLLPLSIGLKSKNIMARTILDYEKNKFTATASYTFLYRSNVFLNRSTYYTTEMHYSNEVYMPNAQLVQLRFGYRSPSIITEILLDQWNTLGGFDMGKNEMPFVCNTMNSTRLGLNFKYNTSFLAGLSFVGNANTTIAGRNVGKSSGFNAGVFYILDFSKKTKTASTK
jgi:hypothetical protein